MSQDRTPAAHVPLGRSAADLDAGEYVWRDVGYGETPVSVVVNLSEQRAYAYRGEALIGAASISTGRAGHRTPVGDFTVLQKRVFHRSNIYSNAPMPYMQRLTWDGIALHAGYNPGHPASHGCIRLPRGFAVALYGVTSTGTPVTIVGRQSGPPPAGARPFIPVIVAEISFDSPARAMVTWRVRPPRARHVGGDEAMVPDAVLQPG